MIRRPPRSTPLYSSAASDVYKRQLLRSLWGVLSSPVVPWVSWCPLASPAVSCGFQADRCPRAACGKLRNSCGHVVRAVDQSPSFRIFHSAFYLPQFRILPIAHTVKSHTKRRRDDGTVSMGRRAGVGPEMDRRAAITCPVVVVKDDGTDDGTVVQQSDGDGDSDTTGH